MSEYGAMNGFYKASGALSGRYDSGRGLYEYAQVIIDMRDNDEAVAALGNVGLPETAYVKVDGVVYRI